MMSIPVGEQVEDHDAFGQRLWRSTRDETGDAALHRPAQAVGQQPADSGREDAHRLLVGQLCGDVDVLTVAKQPPRHLLGGSPGVDVQTRLRASLSGHVQRVDVRPDGAQVEQVTGGDPGPDQVIGQAGELIKAQEHSGAGPVVNLVRHDGRHQRPAQRMAADQVRELCADHAPAGSPRSRPPGTARPAGCSRAAVRAAGSCCAQGVRRSPVG